MDCREFEKLVQDYVEGLCDEKTRLAIEQRRAECSHCNELAMLHEGILAALENTGPVEAPEGLNEKILAAVEAEEMQLAFLEDRIEAVLMNTKPVEAPEGLAEKILAVVEAEEIELAAENDYTRGVLLDALSWTAVAAAALFALIKYSLKDIAGFSQKLGSAYEFNADNVYAGVLTFFTRWISQVNDWFAQLEVPPQWQKAFDTFAGLFNYPVQLPYTQYTIPAYCLAVTATIGASLWYYLATPLISEEEPFQG